jgi:hypothetical protein
MVPMTKRDQSAAATKQDVAMLMEEFGKLYSATERWKDEIKHHFDLQFELAREDLKGATLDRLTSHNRRIARLEKHAGLANAA